MPRTTLSLRNKPDLSIDNIGYRTDAGALKAEARQVYDKARGENRDLTAEEQAFFDAALDQANMIESGFDPTPGRKTKPMQPGGGSFVGPGNGPTWVEAMQDRSLTSRMDQAGFDGLGDYLAAVAGTARGKYDERLGPLDLRAQQGIGVGTEGGFLVPARFSAELLMTAADEAPFLAMREVETITGSGSGLVRAKVNDRDRSGEEYGGIALQRVSENSALAGDQVVFGSEELRLKKAAALIRVSNELMTDSGVGVERALRRVFGRAVQQRQSLDFLSGSGAGEPLGFLLSGALLTHARETANEVSLADIAGMVSKLLPGSQGRAVWIAHPSVAEQVITLSDSASRNVFVGQNAAQSAPTTLLGRPLFYSSAAKALGTQGDISLIDPMAYLYVHRPLAIDVSRDADFDSDQTTFRVVLRDDGHPSYDSSLTDEQSQSLTEFVTLA